MPQDGVAGFNAGAGLNLVGNVFTDTTQAGPPVFFGALIRHDLVRSFGDEPFGNHHQGGAATVMYLFHPLADLVH